MSPKKFLLLASTALVALAFAVPASASAYQWTSNGLELGEGETVAQTFEGRVGYFYAPPAYWTYTSFYCDATIRIEAEGPSGESIPARITQFERDPSSCEGVGPMLGHCKAKSLSSNVASGWSLDVASSPAKLSLPGGYVKINDEYEGSECGKTVRSMEFSNLEFIPTLENGFLKEFRLKGMETSGLMTDEFGPFTPVGPLEIGLK